MEKIDLYNYNKQKLDKTFIRGQDKLLENEYYLLEQAWIINNKNEVLLTQRNFNKSYGGMWEAITGHVKSGETDLEGIENMKNIGQNMAYVLKRLQKSDGNDSKRI